MTDTEPVRGPRPDDPRFDAVARADGMVRRVMLGRETFTRAAYSTDGNRTYKVSRDDGGPVEEAEVDRAHTNEIDHLTDAPVHLLQWGYAGKDTLLPSGSIGSQRYPLLVLQPSVPTVAAFFKGDPKPEQAEPILIRLEWLDLTLALAPVNYPLFTWWFSATYGHGPALVERWCGWHRWVSINKSPTAAKVWDVRLDASAGRVQYSYDRGKSETPSADDPLASFATDPYAWLRDRESCRSVQRYAGL